MKKAPVRPSKPPSLPPLSPVERAALRWWKSHRPAYHAPTSFIGDCDDKPWTEAEHLANPTVNVPNDSEARIARAVARMVKARKGQRKAGKP